MTSQTETKGRSDFLKYSHTIGLCVMEGRGFMFPVDTAITPSGRMHTVSRAFGPVGSHQLRVTMYDTDSTFYGVYGGFGDEIGKFKWPASIESDSDGNLYISDEQCHKINVYNGEGKPIARWGDYGSEFGQMNGPSGIAFESDDNILECDQLNNRIQKFTKDGEFLDCFGSSSVDSEQLSLPWGITVSSNGETYIADWGNDRICKYSQDGTFSDSFGSAGSEDGQFIKPAGIAVDNDGFMYVADWGNERVQALDPKGNCIDNIRGEATISVWGQEFLDSNYEEAEPRARSNLEPDISLFDGDPHTESAHTEKLFWGPTSVKLDENGKLYVTESNRHRIQIYNKSSNT